MDFPSGSAVKNLQNKEQNNNNDSAGVTGDMGSLPGVGRSPGGGHGNPLQYSGLENPHGQRGLAGYSPWGCRVGHD